MSRTLPLRHRLLLSQALAILLLAAGVLTAALWGARRAVQSLSRELVDRAALEVDGASRSACTSPPASTCVL